MGILQPFPPYIRQGQGQTTSYRTKLGPSFQL